MLIIYLFCALVGRAMVYRSIDHGLKRSNCHCVSLGKTLSFTEGFITCDICGLVPLWLFRMNSFLAPDLFPTAVRQMAKGLKDWIWQGWSARVQGWRVCHSLKLSYKCQIGFNWTLAQNNGIYEIHSFLANRKFGFILCLQNYKPFLSNNDTYWSIAMLSD